MALFSKVPLYCNNCGSAMMTNFHQYDGRFCNKMCKEEYELKRATSVMGKIWKENKNDLR